MKSYPKPGNVYTYADLQLLPLEDSPCLNVMLEGILYPVQDSHVTPENVIKDCPVWATSRWRYILTTNESIPVFNFVGSNEELMRLIDFEPGKEYYGMLPCAIWVTPKGNPRAQ
jgi:hypothetical protein